MAHAQHGGLSDNSANVRDHLLDMKRSMSRLIGGARFFIEFRGSAKQILLSPCRHVKCQNDFRHPIENKQE